MSPIDPASSTPALACVPGAIDAADRPAHFALATRLFGDTARERHEIADNAAGEEGYTFRFEADAFDDVARFVAGERRCCPFLMFTLTLAPTGGPLWLRLTGPTGTRSLLDSEFPATPERP